MRGRRLLGALCAVLLASGGQALGWSLLDEVTVMDPGLTAEVVWEMPDAKTYCQGPPSNLDRLACEWRDPDQFWIGLDAEGNRYGMIKMEELDGTFYDIYRRPAGTQLSEPILRITQRIEPVFGEVTKLQATSRWEVDVSNGTLLIGLSGQCLSSACVAESDTHEHLGLIRISGLPGLFAIASTFTPSGALSFRIPAIPEGLPSGDHYDVYAGDLADLPDLSRAQGIGCDVAAGQQTGDWIVFEDPLPPPGPGAGRYYLTAVVSGSETRAGRRCESGALSGRDASTLPGCAGG